MPPDLSPAAEPVGPWPKRFDRTIPRGWAVETAWRDIQVNIQVGPFLAMPVIGIILWTAPEVLAPGLGAAAFLTAAARQSWIRYRHLRM
ncbi:hypothetical protein [Streptomyces sp. NPDC056194]|uniref:hypothetical protein n=1 Tax=Streptomyces sp. NPDC056194 TaxID=3345744 RepID=UPI0035DD4FA1